MSSELKSKTRGRLIVIEGADGTGKATQHAEIVNLYRSKKIKHITFDFPRYETNFWGSMVGRYLNMEFGHMTDISPYFRTMFYILDQASASVEIENHLKKGYDVICNRYVTSNVFQSVGFSSRKERDAFWKWLYNAAFDELGAIKPDIVICLFADPKVAYDNIEKKNARNYTRSKRDMHEKLISLQRNVAEELKYQCKKKSNWHLVKVTEKGKMRPVSEITEDIFGLISK